MAAWALIDIVQAAGFMLQLMKVGPDMQLMSAWYRGAWERVRAFFRRNRKSNASDCMSHMQEADTILVLGARDEEIQLEEGLTWSRGDFQARAEGDGLYRTGRGQGVGEFMQGHPEYVHLQYRQVIVRRNGSWEI
jgi:hypothetical protein